MKRSIILCSLLIPLLISSCFCSNDSKSRSNSLVITTHGGPDNEGWLETPLSTSSLPALQVNVSGGGRSWIYANVLRATEAWIIPDAAVTSSQAQSYASKIKVRSDGWPASLPANFYIWLNAIYPTGTDTSSGTERLTYLHGVWVLTWEGSGTVEMVSSINDGNGIVTLLDDSANGRMVKLLTDKTRYPIIFVRSTDPANPVRNMKMWAPVSDGAGLELTASSDLSRGHVTGSLEPLPGTPEPMFHPAFLNHLNEIPQDTPLRMMDFLRINQSVESWPNRELTWNDRADPSYSYTNLILMDSQWNRHQISSFKSNIGTAYEWLIDMCNTSGHDLWIQVPHIASEDLIRNLARLVAGKNGHAGLNSNLRVWFEFSNEIWNGAGAYLAQYNRARDVAAAHFGVSPDKLTGDQHGWGAGRLQGWALAIFEDEWAKCGKTDDQLINVVAGFALSSAFNQAEIRAAKEIHPNLPEAIATSNYFGYEPSGEIYKLQDWSATDGVNWSSSLITKSLIAIKRNLHDTYNAWTINAQMAKEEGIPLISYEGGQHLLCVGLGDGQDPTFAKFMAFLTFLQRSDYMKQLYTEHYALWNTAGGRTASLFVDISEPSYWGFWGAKEWVDDTRSSSKKWDAFISWGEKMNGVRAPNEPIGNAPALPEKTIKAEAGVSFSTSIEATSGDGAVSVEMLAGDLPTGVTFTPGNNGSATISGTATGSSTSRIIVRALDADKDPAYRVYTISIDPAGMSTHAILYFNGADIPTTVQADNSRNGRYDPQRQTLVLGAKKEIRGIPFSIADGDALFGPEYKDMNITGTGTIAATSPLNMYGGWFVTMTGNLTANAYSNTYTTLRENKFISWSGAMNDNGGVPTSLDVMLVWRKDQFSDYTAGSTYSFGSTDDAATMRVDYNYLISDGNNELRFVILNRQSGVDTWYLSEAAYTKPYIGDGFLELGGFNGSAATGKRWAVFSPTANSFAIPAASSLNYAAQTFGDIQAVGIIYHGERWGWNYNFAFDRFLVLGQK